ncbi:TrgA family protein [Rhodobacter maris]|uniref:TrgA family protein n=1 Tax=Rhodobacter maris TaxID=446682 RepID=A0A285TCR8_9RHOB|nr:TrgA family protein [Rhodobacter maris]SOC19893.1 hypothetical protein SAMN05877831_11869 [Rhodobacter maris]
MQKVVLRDTQVKLPTTAKLFGALGLAATGFLAALLTVPNLPSSDSVSGFLGVAASFGLLLGWRVIGLNPGHGLARACERGVHGALYLLIWTVLFLGAVQVMHRMMLGRYHDPLDAVLDVITQGMKSAAAVLRFDAIALVFLGGMVSAILSEWAWRRWK